MNTLNENERKRVVKEFFVAKYHFEEILLYLKQEIIVTCTNLLNNEISKDTVVERTLKVILKDSDSLRTINFTDKEKINNLKLLIQNIENLENYMKQMVKENKIFEENITKVDRLKELFSIFKGYI